MDREFIGILVVSIFLLPLLFPVSKTIDVNPADQLQKQITPLASDASSFTPLVVNVRVLYPDDQPVRDAGVVAINNEYCFRYSERSNDTGWVTFRIIPGKWSFFAYSGWGNAVANKGIGYLSFALSKTLNSSGEVVLKPETAVELYLNSSIDGLSNLDETELRISESTEAFLGLVDTTALSENNSITLLTNNNLTARISLAKAATRSQSGIMFLSEPIGLQGSIQLNISESNTAEVRFAFRDVVGNLSGGHVQFQIMERTWSWCPHIYDFGFGNLSFIVSPHNFFIIPGVDDWNEASWYRLTFNNRHVKPIVGEEIVLNFGGALSSNVFVTPRAAVDFKPSTQVMLYVRDEFNNVVNEAWCLSEGKRLQPHLAIMTDSGPPSEINMVGGFVAKIPDEFESSENPTYNITYDFGPFGTKTLEGLLYDPDVLKMTIVETGRLIAQSPAIEIDFRMAQIDLYENLFHEMEELLGVPTDYKIGVISNIMHTGFEDEILHGFKLELPLENVFPPTWPLGDGYIGHEMGHGRIHKPPANYLLWGESYATLMGYKARACLFGDQRLFDFLMGGHDLFLRHQHGDPVQTWYDQIEIIQFITYYIDKNYGWDVHGSMILEWENAFAPIRNVLSTNGFSEIEQMATIYSFLVGDNLAWLFGLGNFSTTETTVDTGLNLIMQDQIQTGNDELKVGETTAVTFTASVPIMLRRVPSAINKINVTLAFDNSLARVLQVHKRDLTNNAYWNLTALSNIPGRLSVVLQGSRSITGPGSILHVNLELIPTQKSELHVTILNASTDSGNTLVAEAGGINLSQLLATRPKNLPFEIVWDEEAYYAIVSSNSTISHFVFNQPNLKLSFDVTAPIGTTGFCNVAVSKELLWGDFTVYIDGSLLVKDIDYTETFNGTHYTFDITYFHTSHTIEIRGSEVIPEFPSFLILPLFMIATLLAVIFYRRKSNSLGSL